MKSRVERELKVGRQVERAEEVVRCLNQRYTLHTKRAKT